MRSKEQIAVLHDLFSQINERLDIIGETSDAYFLCQCVEILKQQGATIDAQATRITELEAQLEAAKNQWQPIETAPKDDKEILVMYMHIDTQIVHNGFWLEDQQCPDSTGWWTYLRSEVAREKLEGWRTPTHWMPLPAAPKPLFGELVDKHFPNGIDAAIAEGKA